MRDERSRSGQKVLLLGCCASLLANLVVSLVPTGGPSLSIGLSAAKAQAAKPYRLGLMQLESDAVHDDRVSPMLMSELREALPKRADYELVDTHVNLTQLSLAEDCSVTEVSCLAQICERLKLDGFLFGKLTHDDGEVPMASFRRFDRARGTILSTAIISFGSEAFSPERMQAEVYQLLNKLLGPGPKHATAALPVAAVVPVAAPAPVAAPEPAAPAAAPKPAASDAAPVVATAQPAADPSAAAQATATANAGDALNLKDSLEPNNGLSARKFAGYVLLGGAAASVGLSVLSFVQVDRAANNASFQDYRSAVGAQNAAVKDVCDEASANKRYNLSADGLRQVKSSCSTGTTFEVLQYVFIGSALVTGGLATFLLFGGGGSSSKEKAQATGLRTLTLHPSVGRGGASLNARMRF
jgi:hypothetical protein